MLGGGGLCSFTNHRGGGLTCDLDVCNESNCEDELLGD